ncbi:hypothetical protein R1flu_024310 [Riccia fluitans]|uniref:Uncharacterized protein n=1 Tax=Riccia fluitans TaxID=41844 RepID=A0ABD1XVE0_9MARC
MRSRARLSRPVAAYGPKIRVFEASEARISQRGAWTACLLNEEFESKLSASASVQFRDWGFDSHSAVHCFATSPVPPDEVSTPMRLRNSKPISTPSPLIPPEHQPQSSDILLLSSLSLSSSYALSLRLIHESTDWFMSLWSHYCQQFLKRKKLIIRRLLCHKIILDTIFCLAAEFDPAGIWRLSF